MWCGSEDACWANPRGYGNGWKQNLDKRFVLPPGPVRMAAEYAWDTGPDFDYFEVLISKDGGATYDELAIHDGSSGGYVKESFDLSTYAGQEVLIRFRLDSDGAYSDEDGLYLSDGGGARIRYVEITGHRRDQFKTGSNGWTASVDPPTGGGPFRLEDDPPVDPALLGQCDPQCAPVEERGHSWVAYNPATGLIDRGVNLGIQSPPIRLPAGADQILLEFDMYWDQAPFAETRIVWGWEDSAGDAFPCLHFLHAFQWYTTGSSNGWLRVRVDMTSFIEPGATSVVVNLKAGDWVTLVGTTPGIRLGSGPYYDNVRLIAVTAN